MSTPREKQSLGGNQTTARVRERCTLCLYLRRRSEKSPRRRTPVSETLLRRPAHKREQEACDCLSYDPETGVVPGLTRDRNMRSRCRCSMCPAIHTNSRSWLRSSSTCEPSDPPLKVVCCLFFPRRVSARQSKASKHATEKERNITPEGQSEVCH